MRKFAKIATHKDRRLIGRDDDRAAHREIIFKAPPEREIVSLQIPVLKAVLKGAYNRTLRVGRDHLDVLGEDLVVCEGGETRVCRYLIWRMRMRERGEEAKFVCDRGRRRRRCVGLEQTARNALVARDRERFGDIRQRRRTAIVVIAKMIGI